jgi:putative salt-induced outer membrane protein YdiY
MTADPWDECATPDYAIDLLKAEVERFRTQCGGNCRYWEGRYRDEKAEVERLTAERDEGARWRRQSEAELRAEVERLTAENEILRTMNYHIGQSIGIAAAEIEKWKDRYQAERRDHEATIKHADQLDEECHRLSRYDE